MKRFALLLAVAALAGACSGSPRLNVSPAPTTGAAGRCATCHMAAFETAPDHEGKKPTTCATCHSQNGWRPTRLRHRVWPLTGAHRRASCSYCHRGQPRVFLGTPRRCYGCHRADYEKAPRHVAEHFSTTCTECHTTRAWKPTLRRARAATAPPPAPVVLTPKPAPARRRPARRPAPRPTPRPRPTVTARPKPAPAPRPRPRRNPDVTSGASATR